MVLTKASAPATAPLAATNDEVMHELSATVLMDNKMQTVVFIFMRAPWYHAFFVCQAN